MTAHELIAKYLREYADEPVIVLRGIEYSQMLDAKFERDRLLELIAMQAKQIKIMREQASPNRAEGVRCELE